MDETLVSVAFDISNRSFLVYDMDCPTFLFEILTFNYLRNFSGIGK